VIVCAKLTCKVQTRKEKSKHDGGWLYATLQELAKCVARETRRGAGLLSTDGGDQCWVQ
jgi:hypothetical protein